MSLDMMIEPLKVLEPGFPDTEIYLRLLLPYYPVSRLMNVIELMPHLSKC